MNRVHEGKAVDMKAIEYYVNRKQMQNSLRVTLSIMHKSIVFIILKYFIATSNLKQVQESEYILFQTWHKR